MLRICLGLINRELYHLILDVDYIVESSETCTIHILLSRISKYQFLNSC